MAIFYVNDRSPKKKKQPKTKAQTEAQKKHLAFLRSVGYTGPNKKSCVEFQSLKVESKNVAPVSNSIPGNGFKRSIDDYKWKSGRSESEEVIAETERKKKKIAPICNKGSYQYITDGADVESLGRKV